MLIEPQAQVDWGLYDWRHAMHEGKLNSKLFDVEDVALTIFSSEGENDEESWIWIGLLNDGTYGALVSWCDYTGWD